MANSKANMSKGRNSGRSFVSLATAAAVAAPLTPSVSAQSPGVRRELDGLWSQYQHALAEFLRRYRELAAQGKWAEAGKELEAIEAEAKQ